jgi:hypothetical protein
VPAAGLDDEADVGSSVSSASALMSSSHPHPSVTQSLANKFNIARILDKAHQLRNLGEYEGDLNIDERIVTDLVDACRKVAATLEQQTANPAAKPKLRSPDR